jgi:hypothetical protein
MGPWRPLFVVADIIGGPAPLVQAARGLFKDQAIEESLAVEILAHLRGASKESSLVIAAEKRANLGRSYQARSQSIIAMGTRKRAGRTGKSGDSKGLTIERLAGNYGWISKSKVTKSHTKITRSADTGSSPLRNCLTPSFTR